MDREGQCHIPGAWDSDSLAAILILLMAGTWWVGDRTSMNARRTRNRRQTMQVASGTQNSRNPSVYSGTERSLSVAGLLIGKDFEALNLRPCGSISGTRNEDTRDEPKPLFPRLTLEAGSLKFALDAVEDPRWRPQRPTSYADCSNDGHRDGCAGLILAEHLRHVPNLLGVPKTS